MRRMRSLTFVLAALLAIGLGASVSSATTLTLAEWAVNLDGAVSDSLVPDPVPGNVNTSAFDTSTGLGTVIMTITGAGAHYAGLFVDHEIDETLNGFSNELGSVHGAAPSDVSWEIDEPGWLASNPGDIFTNFMNRALDNTNPPRWPDDVSMALAYSFSLAPGQTAIVKFAISTTDPGGFALEQTDPDSNGGPLFFTTDLTVHGASVPEPSGIALLGSGLVSLVGFAMRRHRK